MNPQLENGYTKIANEIIDVLCRFRMPGECTQVLNCIFRKTYGFNKKEDWIANSQIVGMTGMKKGNASRALSKLITNKIVIKSDNKLRLNKNYKEWVSFKSLSKVITGKRNKTVIQIATAVIQSDNKSLSKVRDTKYNKNNTTKDNIYALEEKDLKEISDKYKIPLTMIKLAKEEMDNWIEAKGKGYKGLNGYKAGLRNWVLRDAKRMIERRESGKSRISIDIAKI